MDTAVVLFTRDLRVHDNPALAGGCARARQVVPLFVVDPALAVPPNRARFLAETVRAATGARAQAVFVAGDVSRYAARREQRLAAECERHRMALAVTAGHQ